ncbi:hypothetical protein J6590_051869 [Homalodisca vitripennis]|nr:hypothetical protein J6590_051869 [Homalodisca vitripennis]
METCGRSNKVTSRGEGGGGGVCDKSKDGTGRSYSPIDSVPATSRSHSPGINLTCPLTHSAAP